MTPAIDAIREQVVCGERRWPFALDLREDVAAIELEGVVYKVRPLRWREKRNLARYARAGAEFIERQFVRLSAINSEALPGEWQAYQVLCALARWINAPGEDSAGLPLETALLAGVTLDLCRMLECQPSDLDGQSAYELERLWASRKSVDGSAAVGRRTTATVTEERAEDVEKVEEVAELARTGRLHWSDPGDMDRIVIVPDPVAPAGAVAGSTAVAGVEEEAATTPAAPVAEERHRERLQGAEVERKAPMRSELAPAQAQSVKEAPVDATAAPVEATPIPIAALSGTAQTRVEQTAVPSIDANPAKPSPFHSVAGAPPPATRTTAAARYRVVIPTSFGGSSPAAGSARETWDGGQPNPAARSSWPEVTVEPVAPSTDFQIPAHPTHAAQAAVTNQPVNTDALFDEWTERLEEAAEEMGIDLEQ